MSGAVLTEFDQKNVMSVTGKNIRQILNETGQTNIFMVEVSEMKK